MIRFNAVSKRYGAVSVLDRVSLEIGAGEFVVLLGGSGSGKTTLLRLINCLLLPDEGCVEVDGRNTSTWAETELRRKCGYVLQEAGLLPHLTVEQNVGLLLATMGEKSDRRPRCHELLRLVELPPKPYALRYPRQLSGGQQQRVNVARALALNPPILLMDEPFGALDEMTRKQMQVALKKMQRELKKTIVFVTHDLFEALQLADRIAVLHEGRLEQYGTPAELLHKPETPYVAELFARPMELLKSVGSSSEEKT